MVGRNIVDRHALNGSGNLGTISARGGDLSNDNPFRTKLGDINPRPIGQHISHREAVVGDLRSAGDLREADWDQIPD